MLEFVERQDSSKPTSPNSMRVTVNQTLFKYIAELATNIMAKYDKASEAFKAYDSRQQGYLTFGDFMSSTIDLKVAGPEFTKDIIL